MASSDAKQKLILYGFALSSSAWRVRAALAYKNIDFDYRVYSPAIATSDERAVFEKLNPLVQVPTLVVNGRTLTQSVAILEYLEDTYPNPPLLPKDVFQRAQVRQIVELINSGIQPLSSPSVAKRDSNDPVKQKEWQIYWIEKGLHALEILLKETHGRCCMGDELTFADIFLIPQIYSAIRFGADLSKFPICSKIFSDLLLLDAFQKTHPIVQPDGKTQTSDPVTEKVKIIKKKQGE